MPFPESTPSIPERRKEYIPPVPPGSPEEQREQIEAQAQKRPRDLTSEEVIKLRRERPGWPEAYSNPPTIRERNAEIEASWQQREADKAKELHLHDALTELPNKQHIDNWLEQRTRRNPSNLWVGFIDLDHFKSINDRYGHDRADEFLRVIATILESLFRIGQNAIAGRRSGDEFLIAIDGAPQSRIAELAKAILEQVSRVGISSNGDVMRLSDEQLHDKTIERLELSIGFAQIKPGMSASELLSSADNAMYSVKEHGRNGYMIVNSAGEQVRSANNS